MKSYLAVEAGAAAAAAEVVDLHSCYTVVVAVGDPNMSSARVLELCSDFSQSQRNYSPGCSRIVVEEE